jgi:hypothetical protein
MSDRYRVGGHWGVTIVEIGDGPLLAEGRRGGDRLVAVAQTEDDAALIVAALNVDGRVLRVHRVRHADRVHADHLDQRLPAPLPLLAALASAGAAVVVAALAERAESDPAEHPSHVPHHPLIRRTRARDRCRLRLWAGSHPGLR